MNISNHNVWLFVALALVVGLGLGYWLGGAKATQSYNDGYQTALGEAQAVQDAAAARAAEAAAQEANPFQAVNPLEGVSANPFQKAKQILNPFQ